MNSTQLIENQPIEHLLARRSLFPKKTVTTPFAKPKPGSVLPKLKKEERRGNCNESANKIAAKLTNGNLYTNDRFQLGKPSMPAG
jgi:hypothetical protein